MTSIVQHCNVPGSLKNIREMLGKPKAKVVQMSEASARAPMARISEVQVEEDEIVPKPWRAPVVRMW